MARPHPGSTSDQTNELLSELDAVYRDTERAFSGWSCPASTECCRFGVTGREPYITAIEEALLRRAIARRGGARAFARSRRTLPMIERPCPLLTSEGRCSVYAARPLGC